MPIRDNPSNLRHDTSFSDYQRGAEVRDKFCKGCGYNLRGLMSGECPECGLPFSLTNPRTYLTSDQLGQNKANQVLPKRRVLNFLISILVAWVIPYSLGLLIALGINPSASSAPSELAVVGCCLYIVFYPVTILIATTCLLNALLPERINGITANILAGALFGGVLMAGQLVLFTGFSPLILALGIVVGLPAGLWRAHQQT
ncbi:MAG: hypothetical protein AAGA25_12525 [Planctomycetota bacterium]